MRWMWAGERRRRGPAIQAVLAAWQPQGKESEARAGTPQSWVRDEDLITGILVLLWQGGSAEDLARWLGGPLLDRYALDATPDQVEALARALVQAYERDLFNR
jgi:hypothetical protein